MNEVNISPFCEVGMIRLAELRRHELRRNNDSAGTVGSDRLPNGI